ncbi:MAG TPA: ABC transporter ATP-binding protein [Candidatus Goldiibacteriota bacterium]|nr:ABC transporter ATP-binding protein [Candidatus Goldiibacteriota bacterium]
MANVIEVKDAKKEYILGKTKVEALRGVNLVVGEGEFLCVVGPSGSGKTTLLNLIGCLDSPTSGEVKLFGKYDVSKLKDKEATALRRDRIGFIFQTFNLIPVLNVYENIEFPLVIQGVAPAERKKRVDEMIKDVGLAEFVKHKPDELSGGQRQRIAVARALITNPKLVLADEPTANLDKENGLNILNIMKHLNEEHKTTFIFSTHDQRVMEQAKRTVVLEDGKVRS